MTLDELVDEIVRYSDGYYGAKMGPVARANIKSLIAENTTMKDGTRRCPPHLLAPHDPKFCLRCGAL